MLDDFLDACSLGGLDALEWQENVLSMWLGLDAQGRWAARNCGLSVARQNGKTLGTSEVRMNGGLLLLGERVVYTSHLQKTSTETFEDMAAFFDSTAKMRKRVAAIKTALGREEIVMKNGGRVKFLARTRNGGRGQHGDLLVFDEAQELSDEQQASFLPALAASANPQTIYTGTPPDENAPGTVFRRIRDDAINGRTKTTAWAEWSVPEIGDVADRERWYEANPSAGLLILESSIEGECEQMAPDRFARERLGWWSDGAQAVDTVIKESDWEQCAGEEPDGCVMSAAVKFAADGSIAALATCARPTDAAPFVRVIDVKAMHDATQPFAEWIAGRMEGVASIALDGRSGVAAMSARLKSLGVPPRAIVEASARDAVAANSMFCDAVASHSVAHGSQPSLDDSATKTAKRKIGADGFGFESTDEGEAVLIEAAALAYWQAMTTKRNPGRKMRVL